MKIFCGINVGNQTVLVTIEKSHTGLEQQTLLGE